MRDAVKLAASSWYALSGYSARARATNASVATPSCTGTGPSAKVRLARRHSEFMVERTTAGSSPSLFHNGDCTGSKECHDLRRAADKHGHGGQLLSRLAPPRWNRGVSNSTCVHVRPSTFTSSMCWRTLRLGLFCRTAEWALATVHRYAAEGQGAHARQRRALVQRYACVATPALLPASATWTGPSCSAPARKQLGQGAASSAVTPHGTGALAPDGQRGHTERLDVCLHHFARQSGRAFRCRWSRAPVSFVSGPHAMKPRPPSRQLGSTTTKRLLAFASANVISCRGEF